MAQTLIASPYGFTPAYNPVKFIIDSTNKNLDGFKYIFDVYAYGTSTKVGEYKVLPRYSDGYGEQDLSKLLSSLVSWDFNPLVVTDYNATQSFYRYDVKMGEEYVAVFNYTSSLTNNGGNVQINVTNTFNIGDQVVITQADGGAANPQLEGLHTVIAASGSAFTVNVSWSTITNAAIDGSVKYADNRKVITRDITTVTNQTAFNGAFRWEAFNNYNAADYELNGTSKKWLTNQPDSFSCTLSQDLWLNLRGRAGSKVVFENSNGDIFTRSQVNSDVINGFAVGPNNHGTLTPTSGTLPLIKSDTEWYDVWYDSSSTVGAQDSQKYRITIDRRPAISEHDIVFLDRLGSWSSFAFQLRSYERIDVSRELYNKDVTGYVNSSKWTYKPEEFGFQTFNINLIRSMDLNTNWMDESAAAYFEELITSPQVFIKSVTYDCDGNTSTDYVPCIVNNSTFEIQKQRNKNLIRQSVNVRFANQDNING